MCHGVLGIGVIYKHNNYDVSGFFFQAIKEICQPFLRWNKSVSTWFIACSKYIYICLLLIIIIVEKKIRTGYLLNVLWFCILQWFFHGNWLFQKFYPNYFWKQTPTPIWIWVIRAWKSFWFKNLDVKNLWILKNL